MGYDSRTERNFHGGYRRRNYGGQRYGDDRRSYRRPSSPDPRDEVEDIEKRLAGLIIKIGDKIAPELRVNLGKMQTILESDYEKFPETVKNTLKSCVTQLPAKAPVYGSLFGLLNASNHDLVSRLIKEFNEMLVNSINSGDWFNVKQILRFYGELVNANVILPGDYCTLINSILAPLEETNSPKKLLDTIVYTVIAILPWGGRELSDRAPQDLDTIIKKVESYMERRGQDEALPIFDSFLQSKFSSSADALVQLWSHIQSLHQNGWKVPLLATPYRWFDDKLNSAIQHDLPPITMPAHLELKAALLPSPQFKLLVDENAKSIPISPKHGQLDHFIVHDIIADTLKIYEPNRKDCAKFLLSIGNSFELGCFRPFVAPLSFEDDHMNEDKNLLSYSDILFESIMAHMLQLPSPPFQQIYYASVLVELCKGDPGTFAKALGRGVSTLYDRLEYLDNECCYRFWSWFAHHLSNFDAEDPEKRESSREGASGMTWDWNAWSYALSLETDHPQACFIRETLEKRVRLGYYERVKATVPEEFATLMAPNAPEPNFAYKSSSHPQHQDAKQLVEFIRSKKSVEEIRDLLEQLQQKEDEKGAADALFIQCLLHVGSKSFSHALNVIERYLDILQEISNTAATRLETVHAVASFWRNNPQNLEIILDKLLNYRVIEPISVIQWICEAEQIRCASRSYIWEIVKNTLNKVTSRVTQLQNKLDNFKELHAANEEERSKGPVTEESRSESQSELEALDQTQRKLDVVESEKREIFVDLFQRLVAVFTDLKSNSESSWNIRWVHGLLTELLRVYHADCSNFLVTLETLVFKANVDKDVLEVFRQIKILQSQGTRKL